jgi:hypothetical protein
MPKRRMIIRSPFQENLGRVAASLNLGRKARVLDGDDVVQLLRIVVEREGGQFAFSRKTGVNRAHLNRILKDKRRVSDSIIKALKLRRVYITD